MFILGFLVGGVVVGIAAVLVTRKNRAGTEKIIADLKSRLNIK